MKKPLMQSMRATGLLAVVMLLALLAGCDNNEAFDKPSKALGVVMYLTPDLDSTYQVLAFAGLASRINREGDYTVVSPTNQAWGDFIKTSELYDSLSQAEFRNVFSDVTLFAYNYVLPGKLMANQLTGGQTQALGGEKMMWQVGTDGKMYAYDGVTGAVLGSANILESNITMGASNGYIHKIDKVIPHPRFPRKTISQYLADTTAFTVLRSAFARVPQYQQLLEGGRGRYTVLAPSDSVFAVYFSKDPNYKSVAQMPADSVKKLVSRFIYKDFVQATLLNGFITPLEPPSPTIRQIRSRNEYYYSINRPPFNNVTYNIRATNGIVHILKVIPTNQ
jgi:uncharacterized surface protein with fasciclin (FAS1) repeats